MESTKRNKRIFLALLIIGIVLFWVAKTFILEKGVSETRTKNYYGEWVSYKFVSPNIVGESSGFLEQSEANEYLKRKIELKESNPTIFDHACKDATHSKSKDSPYNYLFDNYKVIRDAGTGSTVGLMKEMIGLDTDLTDIIEIVCDGDPYVFFVVNEREAIIEYKNTFFFLKKST